MGNEEYLKNFLEGFNGYQNEEIKKIACRTIIEEAKAIENLENFIDDDFVKVVGLLLNSKGRAIFTGIGKSANIAVKTVEYHKYRMMEDLGIKTTAELVRYAVKQGIAEP